MLHCCKEGIGKPQRGTVLQIVLHYTCCCEWVHAEQSIPGGSVQEYWSTHSSHIHNQPCPGSPQAFLRGATPSEGTNASDSTDASNNSSALSAPA
eukprot:1157004-Pelagomonas_calceolata.AAC.4